MTPFGRETMVYADWSASVHATALLKRGDTSAPTCSTCHGSHGATPPGITEVANVCSQCHVREAEFFRESPKKQIFDDIGQPECLVCHSNHRILHPEESWVGLSDPAVCAMCHDSSTKGSDTIVEFGKQFEQLASAITSADAVLTRAQHAGMLVDDGREALKEAAEHRVNAHVLLHRFSAPPLVEVTEQGIAAARRAEASGNSAMQEIRYRRTGLAVATLLIVGFLITLGFKIRSLPADE
jgi:predicted CXXCH cytochrome family protein